MKKYEKITLLALCLLTYQATQCDPTEAEIKDLELKVHALELQQKYEYLKAKQELQECLLNHQEDAHSSSCDEFARTFSILAGHDVAWPFIRGWLDYKQRN